MSWENNGTDPKAPVETASKVETPAVVETTKESKAEEVKAASSTVIEGAESKETVAVEETKADERPMVPQELIGKVAKKIRERSKAQLNDLTEENRRLKEENQRLASGEARVDEDPIEKAENDRIKLKVREVFLNQESAKAIKKYGQAYTDAFETIKSQNDPALVAKIQWADDPTEALFYEAERIAEKIEYGDNPAERERRKEQAIEDRIRKKLEAEFAEKVAARNKQPTDVQNVRAAGGDDRPKTIQESWSTSLPK